MNDLNLNIKIADQPWELEKVCRLNHQTFSEEIPQHERTATGLLIDKFHSENQYIICLVDSEIVGMVALRSIRPFSLDSKLDHLDDYLPPHKSLCEIRLLTVLPEYRRSSIFYSLFKVAFTYFINQKYDLAIISGILSQQRLYRSVGFIPFGPVVGDGVKFQPMYGTPDFFFQSRHKAVHSNPQKGVNALPGPVDLKNIVAEEFRIKPESHRGLKFVQNYKKICNSLCRFVNAEHAQIFTGSATLANEIIVAHLSALSQKGLIVSNGEFGNRIIHQAQSQKISFTEYKVGLGEELSTTFIEQLLEKDHDLKWIYMVHCETSSGVLNDLTGVINICSQKNIKVLVDCVSTFGIVPLDLNKVYMAAASSGKAIGSLPGLAVVFFNGLLKVPENSIPVYLDLWYYIKKEGIPFTLNSNALYALGIAVNIIDIKSRFADITEKSVWLRTQITQLGYDLFPIGCKSLHPAIITIVMPESMDSVLFGRLMEDHNFLVNYNSEYLIRQNMIQICLFSDLSEDDMHFIIHVIKTIKSELTNKGE
jgi:aspartate aminotransferase-like enzyme